MIVCGIEAALVLAYRRAKLSGDPAADAVDALIAAVRGPANNRLSTVGEKISASLLPAAMTGDIKSPCRMEISTD